MDGILASWEAFPEREKAVLVVMLLCVILELWGGGE